MSQSQPSTSQQYKFDPGAMVIVQMGEQLIGHPSTAIGELVKNGYDADATECYVYVHTAVDTAKTFIVIYDNGLGMSPEVLFGAWLRPSISSKRNPDTTKRKSEVFERNFLGSKGIGRLATMALGRYVTVVTKQRKEKEYSWLKIDREAFNSDLSVSEVTFPGGKTGAHPGALFTQEHPFTEANPNPAVNPDLIRFLSKPEIGKFLEGTLLVIEQVDESVRTIMDVERDSSNLLISDTTLFKSIQDLVTPLELNRLVQNDLFKHHIITEGIKIAKELSTFSVFYGSNDFQGDKTFTEVYPIEILHKYDYRVIGQVAADGSVKGFYFCQRLPEIETIREPFELSSNYTLQGEMRDPARRRRASVPSELANAETGPFFFDIRVYDRELDVLEKLGTALNFEGTPATIKKSARLTLERYLGFRVSKNGFGVKPYGEEQKDWLGINLLRVQDPAHVIGVNQILANAFLYSPQNDGLSEKTNREGFFENKAFITFKRILLGVLAYLGQQRYNYRLHYNIGRPSEAYTGVLPDSNAFIKALERSNADQKVIKEAKRFIKDTTTAVDNIQHSLTLSQKLASLGQGLELVYHELAQPITAMGGTRRAIERSAKELADKIIAEKFMAEAKSLRTSLNALDTLKESLRPAIGVSEPEDFKPYDTFLKICHLFNRDIVELDIDIEHDKEVEDFVIHASEYVIWISFLNIINNAVHWLGQSPNKRRIRLSVENNVMSISNSSQRIPDENLEDVFKYGFSTKKVKNPTGLGLSFTKSILYSNGWDIEATNTKIGPTFLISEQKTNE
jgi:signal transduction histidine kinase